METVYLEFEACGQVLIRTDNITVVAGAANLYVARFSFTPEWAGEVKTAQFKLADGTTYDAAITDDTCKIPWEVLHNPGTVIVGIFAGILITTDAARIDVYESTFDPNDAPVNEPTPGALPAAILKAHEYMTTAGEYASDAAESAAAAKASEENAAESEGTAAEKAETATEEAKNAGNSADNAAKSEANAKNYANDANASKTEAAQALSDLLAMMGTDIATLVNGKIPASQIPAIATTEIYYASSAEAMEAVVAQNGDICIRTDESKSYIYKDTGWVFLMSPSDFATNAGYAEQAGVAENAVKINGHRMVEMSFEEYNSAVLDDETYYLVGDPE